MEIVDIRIKNYKTNYKDTNTISHAISGIKHKIKKPYKTYVFVPAHKAFNNIVVICRKYYIVVLRNEIHSSQTFQASNLTDQQIVNEQLNATAQLKAESDNM